MGLFKKTLTVNQATNLAHTTENAELIDCRLKEDYVHGHVSGSTNIPIDKITAERILRRIPDTERKLYIIGSYSCKPDVAAKKFKKLGYKNVIACGCMEDHKGMLTR